MTPVTPGVCPPFIRREMAPGQTGGPAGGGCPLCDRNGAGSGGAGACRFVSKAKFPDLRDLEPQNDPNVPATPCTVIYS